jgi:hypothetical protein
MTRIGHCHIDYPVLAGNALFRRDNLAPLRFSNQTSLLP